MESTEADSYKRYIKYHLRNNIIEILFKKSNCADQASQDRYAHLSKNQKLITKKNTTQRSNMEEALSRRSEINKTFRWSFIFYESHLPHFLKYNHSLLMNITISTRAKSLTSLDNNRHPSIENEETQPSQ